MSFFRFGKSFLQEIARTLKQNVTKSFIQHATHVSKQTQQHVVQYDNTIQLFWSNFSFRGVYSNSVAAHMRRREAHGFLRRNTFKFPMFAFVGLCVSNESSKEVTSIANLYQYINSEMQLFLKEKENADLFPSKFSEYDIKERLGKPSANGAVYSASYHGKEVALKIMFNYEAPSNAAAIYQAFQREYQVLPCTGNSSLQIGEDNVAMVQSIHPNEWIGLNDYGNKARECFNKTPQLEEHPNIMKLHGRFIDKTPLLHDSIDSYPGALPKRLFSDGHGRNQTLCLVMPKFSHSLREYLHKEKLNTSQRTSLFWQLLEGVAYLERHMIAHRDLKSDNLLIDCYGDGYQRLVVTDFGSCLASEDMLLPYETSYIDRGGNIALMAPEIINAVPSRGAYLNYSKTDAWTCGAIAYEIFHGFNPFYNNLYNSDYKDEDLKDIPLDSGNKMIDEVILRLLCKNPEKRLSACDAATILALIFHAPSKWLKCPQDVTEADIDSWLLYLSINTTRDCKLHADGGFLPPDILMKSVFLSRTFTSQIVDALVLVGELQKE